MATERHDKRTLITRDSEQETNDRLDATILDIRTRELAQTKKAYDQARTNLELARRAYKLHLDHMAEELLHDSEETVKATRIKTSFWMGSSHEVQKTQEAIDEECALYEEAATHDDLIDKSINTEIGETHYDRQ